MQSRGDSFFPTSRRQLLAWLASSGVVLGAPLTAFAAREEDPALPSSVVPALFGGHETAVGDPCVYLPKSSVLDRAFADEPYLAQAAANSAQAKWQMLLTDLSTRSPELRIGAVDCFINSFAWIDDDRLYRRADYWATPSEFLANEGGIARILRLPNMSASPSLVSLKIGCASRWYTTGAVIFSMR